MKPQTIKFKLIAGLLALAMMLSLISVPVIAEKREQIRPQSQSVQFVVTAPSRVECGEQFNVVVSISGSYQAHGLTLNFPFDEDAFEFVSVSKGAVLRNDVQEHGGQALLSYSYNSAEGKEILSLGVAMTDAAQPMTMEGELFTLTLMAKTEAADGAYTMAPDITKLVYMPSVTAINIPYTVLPATVSIGMINEAVFNVSTLNNVERGEQFDVVVSISGSYQMHGLALNFPFDENNFEYVSVKKGAVLTDDAQAQGGMVNLSYEYNTTAKKNLLVLGVVMPNPNRPMTMTGELFTLTLKAKTDAASNAYTMAPVVTEMTYIPDSEVLDVEHNVIPATVTVGSFPEIAYEGANGTRIVLGKDAYLTEDGTYTVDLSAYAVGTEIVAQNTATDMDRFSSITDRIGENFDLPDDFADNLDNYVEMYLAMVDSAAMKAEGSTDLTDVKNWIFKNPVKYNDAITKIAADADNAAIESLLYPQTGSSFHPGINFDASTGNVTILGFRWDEIGWNCGMSGTDFNGRRLIVRIKGLTAKENTVPANDIPIDLNGFSGMKQNWRDAIPASLETANGSELLLFPESTVKIREKGIVYDYGLRLVGSDLPGFFAEEGCANDVQRLLSIDYMYEAQRKQNAVNYHGTYPYSGAKGRNIDGDPIVYGDDISYEDDVFKIGFMINGNEIGEHTPQPANGENAVVCYFEPHSVSRGDLTAAALLELTGTQTDVFGNDIKRYEWCKLNAIPASNVLYEAEQGVDDSNPIVLGNKREKLEGSFGIFYSGRERSNGSWTATAAWSVDGDALTDSTQEHYNRLYGYDPVYNGQLAQYASGAAMKVNVGETLYRLVNQGNAQWPVAKFTFEGTGFSFNTVCSLYSGIFAVDVVPHGQPASTETGDAGTSLHTFVNTRYYGAAEENFNETGMLTIDADTLYQVPVMRHANMEYGVYDVYITPVYYPAWAEIHGGSKGADTLKEGQIITGFPGLEAKNYTVVNAVNNGGAAVAAKGEEAAEFICRIDTFRVYHPLGSMPCQNNAAALEYRAAHEMNAEYVKVRDVILGGIENIGNAAVNGFGGAIFIDYGRTDDQTGNLQESHFAPDDPDSFTAMEYALLGPNNEMYLPTDANFTFNVADPYLIANLHLSAKALTGDAAQMEITYLYSDASGRQEVVFTRDVLSATEMYYDIGRVNAEGALLVDDDLVGISVRCTAGTLSLINIKTVYDRCEEEEPVLERSIVGDINTLEAANVVAFGVRGDVNFDGGIDIVDAITVMRAALGIECLGTSARYCANIDRSDAVDSADAVCIIRYALGID